MAYSRTDWRTGETALSADNMNNIENGIEEAMAAVSAEALTTLMLDVFYPVGSYYETDRSEFNPNVAWGGVWELEGAGLVHVGAGGNYNIGTTGGEATHTLSVNEMPSHTHTQKSHTHTQQSHNHTQESHNHTQNAHSHQITTLGNCAKGTSMAGGDTGGTTKRNWVTSTTATNKAATAVNKAATAVNNATTAENNNTGGGQAFNIMQPYKVVNRWHRTE